MGSNFCVLSFFSLYKNGGVQLDSTRRCLFQFGEFTQRFNGLLPPQSAQVQTDEGRNDSRQEESFSVQTLPSEEVQTQAKEEVPTQEAEVSAANKEAQMCSQKAKVPTKETKVSTKV